MTKIKAVLFDMDGTLIDARFWHYEALNEALGIFGYEITLNDHLSKFDGLSTRKKLEILTQEQNFPGQISQIIHNVKQDRTLRIAAQKCYPNIAIQILLNRLKILGIRMGVVTNSIKDTSEFMIKYSGLSDYFEFIISNENVSRPKPDPEGYELAVKLLNLNPNEVVVVEDGKYGIEAARKARIDNVIELGNIEDLDIELLAEYIPGLVNEN